MPLGDLLKEITKMKSDGKRIKLLSDEEDTNYHSENANSRKNKSVGERALAAYGLGDKYGSAYFTKREAECMVLLLKGKTINSVARILNLSPRTVEYYVKNMKSKLGCRTKFELVDLVYASEFMKNVDF